MKVGERANSLRKLEAVNVYITTENHHFFWANQLFLLPCSIANYVSLPEGNQHIPTMGVFFLRHRRESRRSHPDLVR